MYTITECRINKTIEDQARLLAGKFHIGGEVIGASIDRGDPQELQRVVSRGVELGQHDWIQDLYAQEQRKLLG